MRVGHFGVQPNFQHSSCTIFVGFLPHLILTLQSLEFTRWNSRYFRTDGLQEIVGISVFFFICYVTTFAVSNSYSLSDRWMSIEIWWKDKGNKTLSNPGFWGETSPTNRLSHGIASKFDLKQLWYKYTETIISWADILAMQCFIISAFKVLYWGTRFVLWSFLCFLVPHNKFLNQPKLYISILLGAVIYSRSFPFRWVGIDSIPSGVYSRVCVIIDLHKIWNCDAETIFVKYQR